MAASSKKKKIKVIDITSGTSERIELKKRKKEEYEGSEKDREAYETANAGEGKIKIEEESRPKHVEIEKPKEPAGFYDFNKKSSKDIENEEILERIEHRQLPEKHKHKKHPTRGRARSYIAIVVLLALIASGVYFSVTALPRAQVTVTAKTVDWSYGNAVMLDPKIAGIDAVSRKLPSAVFTESKNQSFEFPATGSKFLESKAQGRITIYNEFSPASQTLVATTRFETPDGKIFRLKERTVVPGTSKDSTTGKITPGSIEAIVIADKPGKEYNIGPVSRFSIPGFAGSPRFDKFYAKSLESMSGGSVGEGKYATKEDIDNAKKQAEAKMKETVLAFLRSQAMPDGFKIIGADSQVRIIRTQVMDAVDEAGNFRVFVDAQASMEAVKESQVLELITALARQAIGDGYVIKEYALDYGQISSVVSGKESIVSLPLDFKGKFWKPIEADLFGQIIAGKNENGLKEAVFSSGNIEKVDLTLWPFWVKSVPKNLERIKIQIQ